MSLKGGIKWQDLVKMGLAGIVAPLFALAMSLDIVQKIMQVAAIVTPIMQIADMS